MMSSKPNRLEKGYWLDRVVSDLAEISGELVGKGIASKTTTAGGKLSQHGVVLRHTLDTVDQFVSLVPSLLAEVETLDGDSGGEWVTTAYLRGGRVSSRPQDFCKEGDSILPLRWGRTEPTAKPMANAQRWLLHLADLLSGQLESHGARLTKQVDAARSVRAGQSEYAKLDSAALGGLIAEIDARRRALGVSRQRCQPEPMRPLRASSTPPTPFPHLPSWIRLRQLVLRMSNARSEVAAMLRSAMTAPVSVADEPFLYQRWCGLQMLKSAGRHGWEIRGDWVGALLLGGVVELWRDRSVVQVWIELRVSRETTAASGWASRIGELTPDFLLVVPGRGGRDAFVLDATLSDPNIAIERKGYYADQLVGADAQFIAGVPVPRRPLRSWAIAPFSSSHCRLGDPQGITGAIPLSPDRLDLAPLDAWMSEIFVHAERAAI